MRRVRTCLQSPIRTTCIGILLLVSLAGCIRPVEPEPSVTPGASQVISNPVSTDTTPQPTTASTAGPAITLDSLTEAQRVVLRVYIDLTLGQRLLSESFEVYDVYAVSSDVYIFATSFLNPSSLPCAAATMAQVNPDGSLEPLIGDSLCATELGREAIVASILLLSPQAQPFIATFGEYLSTDFSVGQVVIVFPSGSSPTIGADEINENRFLNVRSDVFEAASNVFFFDTTGVELLSQSVTP